MSSLENTPTSQILENLLPQYQCGACGFGGCAPYAAALAAGTAAPNLCQPGGEAVARLLAERTQQLYQPPVQEPWARRVAVVAEENCIGCALCTKACPVDAIIGAPKQAHTVLADWCTGCGLCITPCPAACLALAPSTAALPATEELHQRYTAKKNREEAKRHKRVSLPQTQAVNQSEPPAMTQQTPPPHTTITAPLSDEMLKKIAEARSASRKKYAVPPKK